MWNVKEALQISRDRTEILERLLNEFGEDWSEYILLDYSRNEGIFKARLSSAVKRDYTDVQFNRILILLDDIKKSILNYYSLKYSEAT